VNSALQRARAAVEERVPDRSQQQTLRALGDDGLSEIVDRWVAAWERNDVDSMAAMLVEDATFAMPPLATWYRTRERIAQWARLTSMSGQWTWRGLATRANGQPAIAFYELDPAVGRFTPFALNVLTLRGSQVADVTAFIVRAAEDPDPETYVNYPRQQRIDERALSVAFKRFGLPASLATVEADGT
jgi:RNA polymerase sigma-70 factor (ECF subfamily)